jgi:hypothetical protein
MAGRVQGRLIKPSSPRILDRARKGGGKVAVVRRRRSSPDRVRTGSLARSDASTLATYRYLRRSPGSSNREKKARRRFAAVRAGA